MTEVYIYILVDPEIDRIYYVGKTILPERRLKGHISNSRYQRNAVEKWIYSLVSKGVSPIMRVIDKGNEDTIDEKEKFWIIFFSKNNLLLNSVHHAGSGKRSGIEQVKQDNVIPVTKRELCTGEIISRMILLLDKRGISILDISNIIKIRISVIKFIIESKSNIV